jgi:hypothetical protein
MTLTQFLKENQQSIAERWLDLTLQSFPPESVRFFKGQKDRFRNPIGHAFRQQTQTLLSGLIDYRPVSELSEALDALARIRAVQETTASQAMQFVFLLKQAIREESKRLQMVHSHDEWSECDSWIDQLALAAFDSYMTCREQIYDIKAREISRRTEKLLERMNRKSRAV